MVPRMLRPVRLCSFLRGASLAALGAVLVASCGAVKDECGSLAALCADEGRWADLAVSVMAAAAVDLDGDGEIEMITLTSSGRQLAIGTRDGWRSMVFVEGQPGALTALEGEVAVSFLDRPLVAIFGLGDDGRLERRRDIPLSSRSVALVSGDLDDDGRLELIASLYEVGKVAVIDPRTGGTREFPAGTGPVSLALGDVDGDARLDVVVFDFVGSALQVLRGAGDGTLMPPRASRADPEVRSLTLADHDGDGDLDAITRDISSSVQVHRNNGAGELSSPIGLPFIAQEASGLGLVAGPVAGGGLAGVSVPQGKVLSTWFGRGATWLGHVEEQLYRTVTWVGGAMADGLLVGGEAFVTPLTYARAVAPIEVWRDAQVHGKSSEIALTTGDLDGDHLLDVVAATSGLVNMLRGRADLGLEEWIAFGIEGAPLSLLVAELTGDGQPDVLVAGDHSVHVAMRTDPGGVALGATAVTAVMPRVLTPLRTGPGKPDVVVAVATDESIYMPEFSLAALLRFAEDGALIEESVVGEGLGVGRVLAVDFDGDDVDEPLILAAREGAPILVHAAPDGAGYSLGVEHDLAALSGLPAEEFNIARMATGDIDGDGAPEVMLSLVSGAIVVSGMADDAPSVAVLPEISGPSDLRDIDGDGRLDAVITVSNWLFRYHRGFGDGTFDPEQPRFELPESSRTALAARPGAQFDLVTLGPGGIRVQLAREVVRPVKADDRFNFHGDVSELAVADVNQDGYDDLVTVCRKAGGGVSVVWGSEDAALDRADGFNDTIDNRGLAVGDLDDDGIPEVIVSNGVSYIEPYRFWPERVAEWLYLDGLFTLERVEDLAIADVDGDDLPDIVAIAYLDYDMWDQMTVYVAYGTEPLEFTEWSQVAAVPELEKGAIEVGDVDGDGDVDLLLRPVGKRPGVLMRGEGARTWAEAEVMPGSTALFGPPDADGRVDLITHEETTVYRHVDGDPDRREVIVSDASLVAGALRQVGDADGDGRYDLVVIDEEATYVWLRGDDGPVRIEVADRPLAAVRFPDLDGDGRPDLVGLSDGKIFVRHTRR